MPVRCRCDMPKERLLLIEGAAKRLGMTAVVDSYEVPGYHAPSLDEDMALASELAFGPTPQYHPEMELS